MTTLLNLVGGIENEESREKVEEIFKAIEADLQRKQLLPADYLITEAVTGNIKVYVAVVDLPKDEFLSKYYGKRKITLGNMCEVEVLRRKDEQKAR